VEWFIADGFDSIHDDRTYECIINPCFATEIRVGFRNIRMTAFTYINQIALAGDTVDGAVGGVDVLIKIAEKNHSNAPCLLKLYKFDTIVAKIVSRICVRSMWAMKHSFLLVIRSYASRVGWLRADLICGDNHGDCSCSAIEGHIGPSSMRVTIVSAYSSCYVALRNERCATRFIRCDCVSVTAADFEFVFVVDLASGDIE
jgi:hypothetical protein